MSLFTVGGMAGFAIGPLMITPVLISFGTHGAIVLALPVLIMALAVTFRSDESLYRWRDGGIRDRSVDDHTGADLLRHPRRDRVGAPGLDYGARRDLPI